MKTSLQQFDDFLLNKRWCWLALETPEPVKAADQEDKAEKQEEKVEGKEERVEAPEAPVASPEELATKAKELLDAADGRFVDLLKKPDYLPQDAQNMMLERLKKGSAMERYPGLSDPIQKNRNQVLGEVAEIVERPSE